MPGVKLLHMRFSCCAMDIPLHQARCFHLQPSSLLVLARLRVYDLPQDCLTASAPAPGLASSSGHDACAAPSDDSARGQDASDDPSVSGDSVAAALVVVEGETIYDFCWYSRMVATDPVSCCFATSSRVRTSGWRSGCSAQAI